MESFPEVYTAAVILSQQDRILAVYNRRWGKFTLPMTKRRKWEDPRCVPKTRDEDWEDVALRAAVEVVGKSFPAGTPALEIIQPLRNYEQSDSDGKWKVYEIHVFGLTIAEGAELAPSTIAEWWLPSDFSSLIRPGTSDKKPSSGTARYVINELRLQGRLPPWTQAGGITGTQ